MPLDEQGDLVDQTPGAVEASDIGVSAPPGYGEHVLDQLYDDVEHSGFQTPAIASGVSSPFYSQSRSGSSENLAGMSHSHPITPAALSSRLANVSLDPTQRNSSYSSLNSFTASGPRSPPSGVRLEPTSNNLTRTNSDEDSHDESGRSSADGIQFDESEFAEMNRVPSYTTAVRTPIRTHSGTSLPDYVTALSAPSTPPAFDSHPDPLSLSTISEETATEERGRPREAPAMRSGESLASGRRLRLLRARDQAV